MGGKAYESQSSQFTDFLLRANRYPSLQMLNLHSLHSRLILVEVVVTDNICFIILPNVVKKDCCEKFPGTTSFLQEYPNVFFSQTRQFHDVLRCIYFKFILIEVVNKRFLVKYVISQVKTHCNNCRIPADGFKNVHFKYVL